MSQVDGEGAALHFSKPSFTFLLSVLSDYSVSKTTASVTTKIFLSQFVNTAIITLIVNAYYGNAGTFLKDLGILDGSYSDYTSECLATLSQGP